MKSKEYEELQNLIDTIVVTARLIGYKIIQENNKTYIYTSNQFIPFFEIKLSKNIDSPIQLETLKGGSYMIFTKLPQKQKIKHLNDLLHSL